MTERVAKTGLHMYAQSVVLALGGGLFWILMAALLGPEEMGKAAYIVSLSTLASTLPALGLNSAVLKLQPQDPFAMYQATLLYLILATPATIAASHLAWQSLGPAGAIACAILALTWPSAVFTSAVIASFQARRLPAYSAASVAARFIVALLLLGSGWVAVAYGYAAGALLYLALVAPTAVLIWGKPSRHGSLRELVKAGLSAWPGQLIAALVMGGGTALSFASQGNRAAGTYYLAYTVASVAVGLPGAIATAALPYFASTRSEPEKLASLTAYVGAPFVAAAVAAPSSILALINREYAQGGPQLALLAPALWLTAVSGVYLNKRYAEGRYLSYAAAYLAFGATLLALSQCTPFEVAALASSLALYALSGASPRHLAPLLTAAPAPLLGMLAPWPLAVAAAFLLSLALSSAVTGADERRVVAELAPKHLKPLVERLTWTA